jgi:hypothetical protein
MASAAMKLGVNNYEGSQTEEAKERKGGREDQQLRTHRTRKRFCIAEGERYTISPADGESEAREVVGEGCRCTGISERISKRG